MLRIYGKSNENGDFLWKIDYVNPIYIFVKGKQWLNIVLSEGLLRRCAGIECKLICYV